MTWRFPLAGLFLFRVVAGHVAQQSWSMDTNSQWSEEVNPEGEVL